MKEGKGKREEGTGKRDCGFRIAEWSVLPMRRPHVDVPSPGTSHESPETSVAEQSHFALNAKAGMWMASIWKSVCWGWGQAAWVSSRDGRCSVGARRAPNCWLLGTGY